MVNRGVCLVVALAVLMAVPGYLRQTDVTQAATPTVTERPTVNINSFRTHGQLAFVWQKKLYVLDGNKGTLKAIADTGEVAYPKWSPDGQWLAYIQLSNPEADTGSLWLVRRDGTGRHQVQMASVPIDCRDFAWSPTTNQLAFLGKQGNVNGLWLVQTSGSSRLISAKDNSINEFAWSPDGKTLAYTITRPANNPDDRTDILYTLPVASSSPTQRLAQKAGIRLAGWWSDGQGLLFWLNPARSQSIATDGLDLNSLALSATTPRRLAETLVRRVWLSKLPNSRQILLVKGESREPWQNKSLAVCDVQVGGCRLLPQPEGKVSLDPALSPDGTRIAFVLADSRAQGLPSEEFAAWAGTKTLWVAKVDGSGARQIKMTPGGGVEWPAWSRNGKHLLYLRDNAVWLLNTDKGEPLQVVQELVAPQVVRGYIHWRDEIAWYR